MRTMDEETGREVDQDEPYRHPVPPRRLPAGLCYCPHDSTTLGRRCSDVNGLCVSPLTLRGVPPDLY